MGTKDYSKGALWIACILALGLVGYVIFQQMAAPPETELVQPEPFEYTPPDNRERIPQPSKIYYLPDSTRLFLIDGAEVTPPADFSKRRKLKVDGDVFFEVPAHKKPMTVQTRLLELTVTEPSVFRVIAFNKDDGEEVQVISGNIRVRKAYESQFNEPDTLRDNQMLMINITIDLMEKEKFDTRDLRAWRDTVRFSPE